MEVESGVTRSILEELHSLDIQEDQIECRRAFTRNITDEIHSRDIQVDQPEGERVVLLEVSSMNLILGMSKEIKWKVIAWCYSKCH